MEEDEKAEDRLVCIPDGKSIGFQSIKPFCKRLRTKNFQSEVLRKDQANSGIFDLQIKTDRCFLDSIPPAEAPENQQSAGQADPLRHEEWIR